MIMPLIKQKLKVDFDISIVTAKRWRDIFQQDRVLALFPLYPVLKI